MKRNAANLAIAQHPTVFAASQGGGPPPADKPRLLIVDDERHVLDGLALHLRRTFDVVARTSGAEALEALASSSFSAVISDLRMPHMDGIQLLRQVRDRAPDTTRVLLTGFADVASAMAAVNEAGVHCFLTKPCPPAQLAAALQEALASTTHARNDKLDEQMSRLGRQATLGTMAGSIGHEIGNLVSALSESLAQVQEQVDRGEVPASEDIGVLGLVKNRMQDHTRALMELSRPRRARIENLDVGMSVCASVELLKKAGLLKATRVLLGLPHAPLYIEADRVLIESVLINLLKNAAEALGEKSMAIMRGALVDESFGEPIVAVAVKMRGESAVVITVEDNGPGVPTESLHRLFRTYFTTKAHCGGTGLGLAIVKETIEQYGGRIDVTSVLGKGTCFTVVLPLAGCPSVTEHDDSPDSGGSLVRIAPRRA